MKRINNIAIGVAGVAASLMAASAMAGIQGSKHDLTVTTGTNNNHVTGGTQEICVFCHTPHGSNTTAVVPLWNRNMPDPAIYTTYDALGTSTLDGTVMQVGSVSLACLSCHDGTQSMDSVINAPGSGGYNPAGARIPGTTWTGTTVNAAGELQAGITLIGTDLRNDHPVGIQYAGGGISHSAPNPGPTAFGDPDFRDVLHTQINSVDYWWVDVNSDSNRTRQDIILYTRDNTAGTIGNEPFVECASCHDPHEDAYGTFLRMSNDSSNLCLACHVK